MKTLTYWNFYFPMWCQVLFWNQSRGWAIHRWVNAWAGFYWFSVHLGRVELRFWRRPR